MKFEVRALRGDAMVSMIIDAVSEREARQQAQQQRLKPVSVRRIAAAGPLAGRRHDFSLLLFSQELLTLLEAGLSVFEALETLHEKEKRPFARSVLASVLARLSEGKPLSTAFGEMPELFPALYTSIIRTAERTSNLPQSLSRYVEYQTRLDGVRAKIASASIYPMVLAVVGAAVMLFLLGYVVPRFAVVYQGTGRELPALSALLLAWGTWVGQHQAIALLGVVGTGAGLGAAVRSLRRGGAFLRWCARLPGMRERIHAYQLARFYLTLACCWRAACRSSRRWNSSMHCCRRSFDRQPRAAPPGSRAARACLPRWNRKRCPRPWSPACCGSANNRAAWAK